MSRRDARIATMRGIFPIEYNLEDTVSSDIVFKSLELSKSDRKYFNRTTQGIKDNVAKINAIISANLKNWSLKRLPKVDLAVLQVAVYEIIYCEKIPIGASINEAVDIAKEYSTKDSGKFVNGVLSGVLRFIEENDIENMVIPEEVAQVEPEEEPIQNQEDIIDFDAQDIETLNNSTIIEDEKPS